MQHNAQNITVHMQCITHNAMNCTQQIAETKSAKVCFHPCTLALPLLGYAFACTHYLIARIFAGFHSVHFVMPACRKIYYQSGPDWHKILLSVRVE